MLCNVKDINWNSNENDIQSKKIADGIECFDIRFADDNTIIVDNRTGRFTHQGKVINLSDDAIKIEDLPACNIHINSRDGEIDIYETHVAKDRKINDFHAIVSDGQLSIHSQSYKELFSQNIQSNHNTKLIVSSNRRYWITTYPFNLLSRDNDNIFSSIKTELEGNCLKLNDDGSFWLSTRHDINFYNPQQECYMTFDCKPFYYFNPVIKEKENQIICYHQDQYDTDDIISCESKKIKDGCVTRWQLPSQQETKTLYGIIDHLTPLQYIFIKDMCTRKKSNPLTLRSQSLHETIFASFELSNREFLASRLGISS